MDSCTSAAEALLLWHMREAIAPTSVSRHSFSLQSRSENFPIMRIYYRFRRSPCVQVNLLKNVERILPCQLFLFENLITVGFLCKYPDSRKKAPISGCLLTSQLDFSPENMLSVEFLAALDGILFYFISFNLFKAQLLYEPEINNVLPRQLQARHYPEDIESYCFNTVAQTWRCLPGCLRYE